MSYGILVVECGDSYCIIGEVCSQNEACELARDYVFHADPDNDLAPENFVIHRRGPNGRYNIREDVTP